MVGCPVKSSIDRHNPEHYWGKQGPGIQQVQDEKRSDHDFPQLMDFLQAKKLSDDPKVAKTPTAHSRKAKVITK